MIHKRTTATPKRRKNQDGDYSVIQIRNVPRRIKQALNARAAAEGISLSAYLRAELKALADLPSEAEVRARPGHAQPFGLRESSASSIRTARAEREDSIRALKLRYKGSASDLEAMIATAKEELPPAQRDFDVRTWFLKWIETPQPCLGGQAPEQLLGTPDGRRVLQRLIGALAGGAYM